MSEKPLYQVPAPTGRGWERCIEGQFKSEKLLVTCTKSEAVLRESCRILQQEGVRAASSILLS